MHAARHSTKHHTEGQAHDDSGVEVGPLRMHSSNVFQCAANWQAAESGVGKASQAQYPTFSFEMVSAIRKNNKNNSKIDFTILCMDRMNIYIKS